MKKLDFASETLHGRTAELDILRDTYKSATNADVHVVLVHGYSGVGKSTIVLKLKQELSDRKDYFICGKFSQLRTTEPYSALTETFNELCDLILASNDTDSVIAALTEEVGSKGYVLLNVVPKLNQLLAVEVDQDVVSTAAAPRKETTLNQLKFVFQAFVRSVCIVQKRPVVLFLDDLQWADGASLELIAAIIGDSKLKNLLFIGLYRDNEVDEKHPLAPHLDQMKQENEHVTNVQVRNLDMESVNTLISDITELRPSLTHSLPHIVYRKTNGNIFFVLQFLQTLQDAGLLFFSLTTYRWEWDTEKINSDTQLEANVVELVAGKIKRLDTRIQELLKLAAALWSTFDSQLLMEVVVNVGEKSEVSEWKCTVSMKEDVVQLLNAATDEELLDKLDGSIYKFAHDRIQQAAYSLIPEGKERNFLHYMIGHLLLQMTNSVRYEEWMWFAAADQMNLGSSVVSSEAERIDLSRLNLQAAERAIALSAFVPASSYLRSAIAYLPNGSRWNDHYSLYLQLHEMLAVREYTIGDIHRAKLVVDEVLTNARSFQDKMNAYHTLLVSFLTEGKSRETVKLSFYLLRKFEEPLPVLTGPTTMNIWSSRLKRMLCGMSDEDMLTLPLMSNERKIAASEVLQLLNISVSLVVMVSAAKLVTIRMMMLSLRYGISEFSTDAFANWGQQLVGEGNIGAGYRFGNLALRLAARFLDQNISNKGVRLS